ncbi:hypothetical protein QFZ22_001947 [Streptomyces canus]|uniref:Uncharacterized protein n=1 Tax=Streptomyces canus TaxID=58343 RepID=A0AAW8FAU7_9ACTN|nr:hypothetical protein [Streptomyces canus]MDQ0905962.1 hypothetical protein [Streptomyces canus]
MREQFATDIDPAALRDLPVHPAIGGNDTGTADLPPLDAPGAASSGSSRIERITSPRANWQAHGIDARLDIVPGAAPDRFACLPAVQQFLASQITPWRGRRRCHPRIVVADGAPAVQPKRSTSASEGAVARDAVRRAPWTAEDAARLI